MSDFNWIDFCFIGLLVFFVLFGFLRGFVREIVSLLSIIIAFFVATLFADHLATLFTTHDTVQTLMNRASDSLGADTVKAVSYMAIAISFAAIFGGIILIGFLFSMATNLVIEGTPLGIVNRLFGGVFGFGKGLLVSLVVAFVVQLTPYSEHDAWDASYLVDRAQPAITWVGRMVSPSLKDMKKHALKVIKSLTNPDGENGSLDRLTQYFR